MIRSTIKRALKRVGILNAPSHASGIITPEKRRCLNSCSSCLANIASILSAMGVLRSSTLSRLHVAACRPCNVSEWRALLAS